MAKRRASAKGPAYTGARLTSLLTMPAIADGGASYREQFLARRVADNRARRAPPAGRRPKAKPAAC